MAEDKRRWATAAQIRWLLAWIAAYLEAQRTNTFHLFWPKLFDAWFKAFPNRQPTAADHTDSEEELDSGSDVPPESADERAVKEHKKKTTRKATKAKAKAKKKILTDSLSRNDKIAGRLVSQKQKQLKTFMRWHCPASRASRKKTGSAACACQIFDDGAAAKPTRRLQETEAYIKLYYDTRMLEPLRLRIAELEKSGPMINTIREVARDLYEKDKDDEATQTAIAACIEEHAEDKRRLQASKQLEGMEPTPEQYQDAITALPAYLESVLREVTRRTGFSATIIVGGPVPMNNGHIQTASISTGKDPRSNATFKDAYTGFDEAVLHPFGDFLRNVYSADVRASRSLNPTIPNSTVVQDTTAAPDTTVAAAAAIPDTTGAAAAAIPSTTGAAAAIPDITITTTPNTTEAQDTPTIIQATPTLSPRLNRKASSSPIAAIPPRPKPTPPGYCSVQALQARALEEAATAKKKLADDRALAVEEAAAAEKQCADEQAVAAAAPQGAATAEEDRLAAEGDRLAAEGLQLAAAAARLAYQTDQAADPITNTAASPPSVPSTTSAAVVEAAHTRSGRKVTVSAGGEALAKEREIAKAKSLKAAENRARKRKHTAENEPAAGSTKKPRVSSSTTKVAAKKKQKP